ARDDQVLLQPEEVQQLSRAARHRVSRRASNGHADGSVTKRTDGRCIDSSGRQGAKLFGWTRRAPMISFAMAICSWRTPSAPSSRGKDAMSFGPRWGSHRISLTPGHVRSFAWD